MPGTGSKKRHALVLICVTQRASKSEKACGVLEAPCSYETAMGVSSFMPSLYLQSFPHEDDFLMTQSFILNSFFELLPLIKISLTKDTVACQLTFLIMLRPKKFIVVVLPLTDWKSDLRQCIFEKKVGRKMFKLTCQHFKLRATITSQRLNFERLIIQKLN